MKWEGRIDGTEEDVLRVHQVINVCSLKDLENIEDDNIEKVIFVTFASHEGVRKNLGRLGAKDGWRNIKKYLGSFPLLDTKIRFYDLKEIIFVDEGELEEGQRKLAEVVTKLKRKGFFVIVLGGGHEVAYGTHCGIVNYALEKNKNPKIGIINFDAHFDMRSYESGGTSGTMFLQIADDYKKNGLAYNYNVFGIQSFSNTKRLFATAKEHGVNYILASELDLSAMDEIKNIINENQEIHLTICADVFHISTAPGVSAPQPLGIMPILGTKLLRGIGKYSRNLTLDIAEVNPEYDHDERTARFMASLIYEIIIAHSEAKNDL